MEIATGIGLQGRFRNLEANIFATLKHEKGFFLEDVVKKIANRFKIFNWNAGLNQNTEYFN